MNTIPTITQCAICGGRALGPGTTTVMLERDATIVVVRHVPATVCATCGEAYTSEAVTSEVHAIGSAAIAAGVTSQISDYRPRVAVPA